MSYQDKYGNERSSLGHFSSHLVGGDSVDQTGGDVNRDDDQFSAAEKVRNYQSSLNVSNSADSANNQVNVGVAKSDYAGGGGGVFLAGILVVAAILAVALLCIYMSSTGFAEIYRFLGAFGSIVLLATPIVFLAALYNFKAVANTKSVLKILGILIVWFFLRAMMMSISVFIDLGVSVLLLMVIFKSKPAIGKSDKP